MIKNNALAGRPVIVLGTRLLWAPLFLTAALCLACATQPRLVGVWVDSEKGRDLPIPGSNPNENPPFEAWEFQPNNTFRMSEGDHQLAGKYNILSDGTINLEFRGGSVATAKIQDNKLIVNWGTESSVLRRSN